MLKIIFCGLICFGAPIVKMDNVDEFVSKFHQNDYKLSFTRAEVLHYEKSVVKFLKVVTFKYNRTQAVLNASGELNVNVGYDMQILVQGYKFTSNEYRTFPIRFQVNMCTALEHNLGGVGDAFFKENPGCPFRKDVVYGITNFYPDESQLPPFMPNGEYKFTCTAFYFNKNVTSANIYVEIYRPILIKD